MCASSTDKYFHACTTKASKTQLITWVTHPIVKTKSERDEQHVGLLTETAELHYGTLQHNRVVVHSHGKTGHYQDT